VSGMGRREFVALLGGAAAVWPLAARAQHAGKMWRIGFITQAESNIYEVLFEHLRELGYVEGQNIIIERRYAEGRAERFQKFAAEMVRLKADLIITITTPAALAAKNATTTIPIVIPTAIDPVGTGLIASLAHPGGQSHEVQGPKDFEVAFAKIAEERPDALFVLDDALTIAYRKEIADFAMQKRLPSVFAAKDRVEAGGLMSYGPRYSEMMRRAASLVDKILRGAQPANLPMEQPTTFELVINLKTAKAIGLTVPPPLLARADEVIE
jgi:putative ABC transport system substrate-binding protein